MAMMPRRDDLDKLQDDALSAWKACLLRGGDPSFALTRSMLDFYEALLRASPDERERRLRASSEAAESLCRRLLPASTTVVTPFLGSEPGSWSEALTALRSTQAVPVPGQPHVKTFLPLEPEDRLYLGAPVDPPAEEVDVCLSMLPSPPRRDLRVRWSPDRPVTPTFTPRAPRKRTILGRIFALFGRRG